MKFKIDKGLVPIKAHFFFFFAALGPILPQLNVFGRQLGVSPSTMGLVTAVLPLLWALAKPLFGYVVDYWPAHRKLVFMLLISLMSGSYCCLWFLPMPDLPEPTIAEYIYQLNDTIYLKRIDDSNLEVEKYSCHWNCCNDTRFDIYLTNSSYVNTIYVDAHLTNDSCSLFHMDLDSIREGETVCIPKTGCNLLCYEDELDLRDLNRRKRAIDGLTSDMFNNNATNIKVNRDIIDASNRDNVTNNGTDIDDNDNHVIVDINNGNISDKDVRNKVKIPPRTAEDVTDDAVGIYMTATFWGFVVLMCIGTVAFNVANCIGDAVCFDVLGPEGGSKYGAQRAWGTAGYGLTALAGGWLIDLVSGSAYKDFTPAFVIALTATVVDLYSCRSLTLPSLSSPEDSGKALREVLRIPRVLLFITFAVVAGTFDSFIIYYMFWFLEEIAESTGHTVQIKFIEGVVVAAQSFIGELLFFFFSGKIIKRFGFGATLTFSLICYGIRMALISLITNPWHLVFIEGIMQGPTYALCYSSIVGYAAHVAPEGYSATIQGIVAGMDDGLGFALGSLVGGQLYSRVGGRTAFQVFACVACAGGALHAALYAVVGTEKKLQPDIEIEEDEKMLPSAPHSTIVYRDTVEPLTDRNYNSYESTVHSAGMRPLSRFPARASHKQYFPRYPTRVVAPLKSNIMFTCCLHLLLIYWYYIRLYI